MLSAQEFGDDDSYCRKTTNFLVSSQGRFAQLMGRYFNCWRLTYGGQSYSSNRSTVGAAQSEPILVQN
uniref:Uncharacterized protein n=1 Tax=Romanomermis culicivorax TaxID=13658 RepID=A0A915JPI4_ROMCU